MEPCRLTKQSPSNHAAQIAAASSPLEISARTRARLAGVFEALEGFPAAFGQTVVFGSLVIAGDAAATAHNILANQTLFRLGFLIPLLAVGFHVVWAVLFFQLFSIVNRTVALIGLVAMLVGCAIQAAATIPYLGALLILQSPSSLRDFSTAQQQQLGLFLLNLSHSTFGTYLIFFGFWCVLAGYLIIKAGFVPRILGVLLILDGVGWMTLLWPPLATSIYTAISIVAACAEFPLLLWFIIFGVDNERWQRRAPAASVPAPA